jgi:hypothetical protein
MLFLGEPAEPLLEVEGKPRAERPDLRSQPERQPLRPSAVK